MQFHSDEKSFEENINQVQRFFEIFMSFNEQFKKINSSQLSSISAYQELYNKQRDECKGYVCQQNQLYRQVLQEKFEQSQS